jgi:hypothetical protein
VRERTCRAVRAEQRDTHRLAGALLDSLRASIVVEVRLGEARGDGVDLDPGRLQLDCADAAPILAAEHEPGEALARWMQRYVDFIAAKRGLATALHAGNPAYDTLPAYFQKRLEPALRTLLESAGAAGVVRSDIAAKDLLGAVASLCMHAYNQGPEPARRMVSLWLTGYATARAHR